MIRYSLKYYKLAFRIIYFIRHVYLYYVFYADRGSIYESFLYGLIEVKLSGSERGNRYDIKIGYTT